jgi:hypothetical protein
VLVVRHRLAALDQRAFTVQTAEPEACLGDFREDKNRMCVRSQRLGAGHFRIQ